MLLLATSSDEAAERALSFAQGVFDADCAAFYKIDRARQPYDYTLRDVCPEFHRHYVGRMSRHDPLNVQTMVARDVSVGHIEASSPGGDPYEVFLAAFGLSAAVELLFARDDIVHGGMCLMWRDVPTDFAATLRLAARVRDYLEFTLRPSAKPTERFGLTKRETEVAKLLCYGRTNAEIADLLGIGIATVKTHLIKMYIKLGVETRAAAAGRLSSH